MFNPSIKFLFSILLILPPGVYAQSADDVDTFLDQWHDAAAKANTEAFFGAIAEDGRNRTLE